MPQRKTLVERKLRVQPPAGIKHTAKKHATKKGGFALPRISPIVKNVLLGPVGSYVLRQAVKKITGNGLVRPGGNRRTGGLKIIQVRPKY